MPIYLVDTTSTFRMKYAIEAKSAEHAKDEITMTEHNRTFDEVTQKWLGEQIIDVREITEHQLEVLVSALAEDKDEMSSHWMGLESLVHKVKYED